MKIVSLDIVPSYAQGFTFTWFISDTLETPPPYVFFVEQAYDPKGPWETIADELVNVFSYQEEGVRRVIPKNRHLFFRVRMEAGGGTYYSVVREPWHDLNRREFLIAREMMRTEYVQLSKMSGIQADLYIKDLFSAPCTECRINPVTGQPMDEECDVCHGTGKAIPYHGPYSTWVEFSPEKRKVDRDTESRNIVIHTVRMLADVPIKKDSVIIDRAADKRYIVHDMEALAEIRRTPIVYNVQAREAHTNDPVYGL